MARRFSTVLEPVVVALLLGHCRDRKRRLGCVAVLLVVASVLAVPSAGRADSPRTLQNGDVLVGSTPQVGSAPGSIGWYSGAPLALVKTLRAGGYGMAIDGQRDLYAATVTTDGFQDTIAKYDNTGALLGNIGSGLGCANDVARGHNGTLYVADGCPPGPYGILKFDAHGNAAGSVAIPNCTSSDTGGCAGSLDLSPDNCRIYYTARASVYWVDTCQGTTGGYTDIQQFPCTEPACGNVTPQGAAVFVRVMADGDLLVTDTNPNVQVFRVHDGVVVATYAFDHQFDNPGLSLDPDGHSFWVTDGTSHAYRVDLDTGKVTAHLSHPDAYAIEVVGDPSPGHGTRLVVNTTSDTPSASPGTEACADATGNCSLRAAIDAANAIAAADPTAQPDITFDLPGSSVQTISLTSALPKLTDSVNIDATSQPDYTGSPLVRLKGVPNFDGLTLGSGSTVEGLLIEGFDHGVTVVGSGNALTLDSIGQNDTEAAGSSGNNTGVLVNGSGNTIGPGDLISGNVHDGVVLQGASNTLDGELIGTTANGGAPLGNGDSGVVVTGASNTVGGVGQRGDLISGNTTGVYLNGAGATDNQVESDFIGTDQAGTQPVPNKVGVFVGGGATRNKIGTVGGSDVVSGNSQANVVISHADGNQLTDDMIGPNAAGSKLCNSCSGFGVQLTAASDNQVGAPAAGNTISGNGTGVQITGDSTNNTLLGNRIGIVASDVQALPNGEGVMIYGSGDGTAPSDTAIGGPGAGEGNVIAGNSGDGVEIGITSTPDGTSFNLIEGNHIGVVDQGGIDLAVPNHNDGVEIQGSDHDTVGGNAISGNSADGIALTDTRGTAVLENKIGTDSSGTAARPNGGFGVNVTSGEEEQIGAATHGNLISGNTQNGVYFHGGSGDRFGGGSNNTIQGNTIGTDLDGKPLPNSSGIVLINTRDSHIGGTGQGEGNVIADNNVTGVVITSTVGPAVNGVGDEILGNKIYKNEGLGIDLNADGVTPNSPGSPHVGPNHLQSFPVLSTSPGASEQTNVSGTLDSSPRHDYLIQLFGNIGCDRSGYGQGTVLLADVTIATDASGHATFLAPVRGTTWTITATATDLSTGDTSEFSKCAGAAAPAVQDLKLSPSTFVPLPNGGSARAGRLRYGTIVRFQLDQPATIGFIVQRAARGRTGRHHSCQAPGNRHVTAKQMCTRYVRVPGAFTRAGKLGANHFLFTGRMKRKALRPGNYRLVATPKSPASQPAHVAFRILR